MKKRLKLLLEQSEKRERINTLLAKDELSEEERADMAALTKRMQDIEPELRAAMVAEGEEETRAADPADMESVELRSLLRRSTLGAFFDSALDRAPVDGAEAELQQHFRLAGNQVPIEMLRSESRAVTPGPANVAAQEQPLILPIFSEGDAAFLAVDMPTVPSGEAVFPVMTSRPTVHGPFAASDAAGETTGAFEAEVLGPERLQASFFYKRVDGAKFAQLDSGLRQALSSALSEALDKKVVDQIVTDVAQTAAAAADTHSSYKMNLVYGRIDGRYATGEGAVRLLVGAKTLAHMASSYRANTADDHALTSIRNAGSLVRVSPHIAAVASNKQDALVRLGSRRDAVAPIWRVVTIIPDEITKVGTGEINLTAVALANFKVLRTGAFARIQTQHA